MAFVALAQPVNTRAMRSTAIGPSGADAANHQAENEWQPGIIVEGCRRTIACTCTKDASAVEVTRPVRPAGIVGIAISHGATTLTTATAAAPCAAAAVVEAAVLDWAAATATAALLGPCCTTVA